MNEHIHAPAEPVEGQTLIVDDSSARQHEVVVHVDGRQVRVSLGEKAEFMAHQIPNPEHDPNDPHSPRTITRWRRLP